jgi:hypothetical protein
MRFTTLLATLATPVVLSAVAVPVAAQASPSLSDLGFMSGCWEGPFGNGGIIEERYTSPSDNVMLGTTRYLRGSRAVQFELTILRADEEGGVTLHPHPGGTPSDHRFRLVSVTGGETPSAVFHAPENDFPQRIVYSRAPGTPAVLLARIDNGEASAQVQEWRMTAAPCTRG